MRVIKAKRYAIILSAFIVSIAQAVGMRTAVNLEPIKEVLAYVESTDLVVFDVDHMLIMLADQILHYPQKEHFDRTLEKSLMYLPQEKRAEASSKYRNIILRYAPFTYVDSEIMLILNSLRHRNIKTIALTHTPTGKCGLIRDLVEWRIQQLRLLGIDFSWSFPDISQMVLDDLEIFSYGKLPLFQSGVLFTNRVDKGLVLDSFLQRIQYNPRILVFADDKKNNVISVVRQYEKTNTAVIGFHYTAVKDARRTEINEQRVQLQFDTLLRDEQWLTDKQADEILVGQKNKHHFVIQ